MAVEDAGVGPLGPPPAAAWRHRDARDGFEVTFLRPLPGGGLRLEGHTAAVEAGEAWAVGYAVEVDDGWRTRRAEAWGATAAGEHRTRVESDGAGHWVVDGVPAPHLDGCLDLDLESSACTNTLPIHRLGLAVGDGGDSPAAYVRAVDLRLERLDQRYTRAPDAGDSRRYDYLSPAFDFAARLTFDRAGLVLDYPGIATRAF
jgi:hypothetical protein